MKKLIYFTGGIDSPFFTNEISYFTRSFDEVLVITYNGKKSVSEALSKKYNFKYKFINRVKILGLFFRVLSRKYKDNFIKEELKAIKGCTLSAIKKKLYIIYYIIYSIKVDKILKNYLNFKDEFYAYSFWLSRPAFAVAKLNYEKRLVNAVTRTHRYDLYEEKNSFGFLPFRKFICENIDVIYFSSNDTKEYFSKKNYSQRKQPQYKLSYLGTNPSEIKNIDNSKRDITIASCSYIIQRKRLDLIILFIKELSKYNVKLKWIHIGDGELQGEIKSLAQKELKGVDYRFLGKMSDEDIFKVYKAFDVDFFINLSDSEGIPVSMLEAMSMGIPVIARDVGGISDAINNENGLLISNVNDIVQEIIRGSAFVNTMFTNKDLYREYSKNSYKTWRSKFDSSCNFTDLVGDILTNDIIASLE